MMNFHEAKSKLSTIKQEHLLKYWDNLSPDSQKALLEQINDLDETFFQKQKELLNQPLSPPKELKSFSNYSLSGNKADQKEGRRLLSKGLMGCILIAGGQGTRLGFNGPKGLFPITKIKQKTLFQLFAEKVVAASKQAQCKLQVAIMTSPFNHLAIWNHFVANNFFGLDSEQVSFFIQGTLPFLNQEGDLFLERENLIAQGPDGNGSSLKNFFEAALWAKWLLAGVRYVNYVLIDNPLADPFDAELLGFHHRKKAEITVKCTTRRNVEEKVGLLTCTEDGVRVVEYSEMPQQEGIAQQPDGTLKHKCANLSLFCMNMDIVKQAALHYKAMPLHCALKAAKEIDKPTTVWKFETYIFDVLPFANKVSALLYPHEQCFAPLKNFEGNNSVDTVQDALQKEDRRIIKNLTGMTPPSHPFELSPAFYYPTPDLAKRWKNKPLPEKNYIEP